jgi:hypothetical protein
VDATHTATIVESYKVDVMIEWLNLLGYKTIKEYSPKWLLNPKTGCRLRLDIYIPKLRLAIEYDGKQHYRKAKYQTKTQFKDGQARDKIKNKLCKDKKVTLVRITYKDYFSYRMFLKKLMKHRKEISDAYRRSHSRANES